MPRTPKIPKLDYYGVVDTGASDPSTAEQGELFYNTTESSFKIYISGAWVLLSNADISAGLDNLLLTNGDNFLLTSGGGEDVLLLTSA